MTKKQDLSEDQCEDIMNEACRLYKEYQSSMAGKVTAQYCRKEDQFEYWVMIATQTALQDRKY